MESQRQVIVVSIAAQVATIFALSGTAYMTLSLSNGGTPRLDFETLNGSFTVLFLFASIPLLLVGLVLMPWNYKLGAKLDLIASFFAWGYFFVSWCVLSLAWTPMIFFLSSEYVFMFVITPLVLYFNQRAARRVIALDLPVQHTDL